MYIVSVRVFNLDAHPAIHVVSEYQCRSGPLLLFSQIYCRRNMKLLLLLLLFPPVLLQLLIQQLSAFNCCCLSMSLLHSTSLLPALISHSISAHSCVAELLQSCAGRQLHLTLA